MIHSTEGTLGLLDLGLFLNVCLGRLDQGTRFLPFAIIRSLASLNGGNPGYPRFLATPHFAMIVECALWKPRGLVS